MCCSDSQIPHMIFLIIITTMFISFQSTPILVGGFSLNAAGYFNGYGLQDLHYLEESGEGEDKHIEKVSGEDESEENKALILEKFRALLGLRSLNSNTHSNGGVEDGSPSPSPSATIEAPVPAPKLPIPVHSHHPRHRWHPVPPPHKTRREEEENRSKVKRMMIAIFLSVGAATVLSAIGLIWVYWKFRRQRKRSTSPVSIYSNGGGSKYVNSQNPGKKVGSQPGLDLFYLDSLQSALEPAAFCLKQNSEIACTLSNENTSTYKLNERAELQEEPIRSESGDNCCSSIAGEIVSVDSVHESAESVKYEPDGYNSSSGDEIVPAEANSSDNESFHSFCDSHSSEKRLSNASAGSLSDTSEILYPKVSKVTPSVNSPRDLTATASTPATKSISALTRSSNYQKEFATPPPPPPPPPLPSSRLHISPSHSSSCSTAITSKAICSSTLPYLLSPRKSDSSSGSNQTPRSEVPPSPPNPPKGIPPPPCPPPFFKASSYSLKGPPPPPSQLMQFTPLGKDGAPLPKLKPLHWDKVRAAPDRSMVWDKLRSNSFEFDEEMIESLFGYNIQNTLKNDEAKSKSPSPSKHVLEPKRLQNITILAKALNVTAEQICDALVQGEGLCLQQLEALVKMVPTKEEEAKLSSYKGDINELGSAENFVKAVLNIPFAFLRIEAMLYRETFEDEVVHLRKSFSMLEEACKELRSSRLFLKLLEAVLKTGNRMNVGTIRGGARAFKLDALLKLADVKGTDGRTTLLHFVVQEIVRSEGIRVSDSIMGKIIQRNKSNNVEEREEDYRRMGLDLVSGLSTEFCNVKKTATVDLDVLASSVSNLLEGMAKLKHLVGKNLCMDEKSVKFVCSMRSFLGYAEMNIKELQEDEGRVLLHVREITEYFHGDVSKDEANPLRIFVIVRDFLGMLDHVCKELRSSKVPSTNPLAPFK